MRKDQKSWDEYHKWDKEFCTDAAPTYWECWQAALAVAQAETHNVNREVGHKAPSPPETIWRSFRGIENGECTVVRWSTEQESDSDVQYVRASELEGHIDKRFTDIQPMVCKDPKAGIEPSLLYILEHYYKSHGIKLNTARTLSREYIAQWVKQESFNARNSTVCITTTKEKS